MTNPLKLNALLGGVLIAGLLVPGAHAQTPAVLPVQKPITLKLGVYIPTSSSGRDAGGNGQFSLGADYALAKTVAANPLLPSVYFDYEGGSRHGGRANIYGLGVAARYYSGRPALARVSPYLGIGLGVYDADLRRSGQGGGNTVSIGGKVLAGVEFSQSFLVEANYQFLPKHNGINPDGLGVQLGYRF